MTHTPAKTRVSGFLRRPVPETRLQRSQSTFPQRLTTSTPPKPASGVPYYGYRFYAPEMGRWLNRDPIEEWGSVNLYIFVGNDGFNSFDLIGLTKGVYYLNFVSKHKIQLAEDEVLMRFVDCKCYFRKRHSALVIETIDTRKITWEANIGFSYELMKKIMEKVKIPYTPFNIGQVIKVGEWLNQEVIPLPLDSEFKIISDEYIGQTTSGGVRFASWDAEKVRPGDPKEYRIVPANWKYECEPHRQQRNLIGEAFDWSQEKEDEFLDNEDKYPI